MEQQNNPFGLILTLIAFAVMIFCVYKWNSEGLNSKVVRMGFSLIAMAGTMVIVGFILTYLFEPNVAGGDAAGNGMAKGLFFFYIILPTSFCLAMLVWGILVWILKINLYYYTGAVLAVTLIPFAFMQMTSGLKKRTEIRWQQTQIHEYSVKIKELFTQLEKSDLAKSVEDSDLEVEKIKQSFKDTKFRLELGVRYFAEAYGLAHGIPEHELSDIKQGIDLYVSPLLKSVFLKEDSGMKWADTDIHIIEVTPEQKKSKVPYLNLIQVVSLQDVGIFSYGLVVRFENAPNSSVNYFINAGLQSETCPEGFHFAYSQFYCVTNAFIGNEDMNEFLGFINFNKLSDIVAY